MQDYDSHSLMASLYEEYGEVRAKKGESNFTAYF
jgi:hypothetical protein